MDIQGKLLNVLELVKGESKNGAWKKQDIVIETKGQYPKKICFSIWNDKIDASVLEIGKELKVFFEPESREYNGRWFTELRAWKVEKSSNENVNNFSSQNDTAVEEDQMPF